MGTQRPSVYVNNSLLHDEGVLGDLGDVHSWTVTSDCASAARGMEIRRLHRLHFNSTPLLPSFATSCPHWQRASVTSGPDGTTVAASRLPSIMVFGEQIKLRMISFIIKYEIENHY